MCRMTLPTVFEETETGQSRAAHPPMAPLEEIIDAASTCPVGAISIVDPDTGRVII
jgi:ferredoxin